MVKDKTVEMLLISVRKKVFRKNCLFNDMVDIKGNIEYERDSNITCNYSQKITSNVKISPIEQKCIKIIDTYQSQLNKLSDEYEHLNVEIDGVKGEMNLAFENSKMTIAEYEVLDFYYFEGKNVGEISEKCNYSYGYIGQLKRQAIKKFTEYNNCKNL